MGGRVTWQTRGKGGSVGSGELIIFKGMMIP